MNQRYTNAFDMDYDIPFKVIEVILKVEPKIDEGFWYGLWYPIQGYQLTVVMVDPYKLTYLSLLDLETCTIYIF